MATLSNFPQVLTVQPVGQIRGNSIPFQDSDYVGMGYQTQWNLSSIHALSAWDLIYGGANPYSSVSLGVIDQGMYLSHEEDVYSDLVLDTTENLTCTSAEKSRCRHGMHVGGIISAGKNSKGSVGIAWSRAVN